MCVGGGGEGILSKGIITKSKESNPYTLPTHRVYQDACRLHLRAEKRATVVALLGQEILQRGEKTLGAQFHSSLLVPLGNNSSFAPKHLGFVVTAF